MILYLTHFIQNKSVYFYFVTGSELISIVHDTKDY